MSVRVDTYWPLLFLAAVPYIWWVQKRTLTDLDPKQLRLSATIRSALIVLLALAMTGPLIERTSKSMSVMYLLDVSQSVSPRAIQSAIRWIEETNSKGHPDRAGFIPFAANSQILEKAEQLKDVRVSSGNTRESINQSGTDIERAFETAIRNFAPNHLKRLVLLSDGNETSGDVAKTMSRLKAQGIEVFTIPSQGRSNGDVWIENLKMPNEVVTQESFPVEVQVYSQVQTPARINIRQGKRRLQLKKVQLVRGLNRVEFEINLKRELDPVAVEAEVYVEGDPFPANNRFHSTVLVRDRPKILYVESRPESSRYLRSALIAEGLKVTTVEPSGIPRTIRELDAYEEVILSDVARDQISDAQMKMLDTYVRDLGGGLILAGGENNYGEGGYSKTALEEVLPVKFEKKNHSVAMIMVLDKSGSMKGDKIEMTKAAAKASLAMLKDKDSFGVVAFDWKYYWPVKFQSVANRDEMDRDISTIVADGLTNLYPALQEAFTQLNGSFSQVKHVVILSDGISPPGDFQGLTQKMADAKITVSTVAVSSAADRNLLEQIAKWGHGRTYYLNNPAGVPQIFSDETEMASKSLREESFTPTVKKEVQAFKGIDFKTVPLLKGYVATTSKDTSELLLETQDHDPLLVRWQYGLGRTAAFLSDVKDRWAVDWLKWNGYPKFWAQLVRETMRRPDHGDFDFKVVKGGDEALISITSVDKEGQFRNKLNPKVRISRPDQKSEELPIHQVGPGEYKTKYRLPQEGNYVFQAIATGGLRASRILSYSYLDEYHFYPTNMKLLRTISNQTGGKFQPRPEEIFDTGNETVLTPVPLWPYLTAISLIVFLADILIRRIRLFE